MLFDQMDLKDTLEAAPLVLTECAIAERLRRRPDVDLHPTLFNTPLIYEVEGGAKMAEIYGEYRRIAKEAALPIVLCAPTWRVDQKRTLEAGFEPKLNRDAVRFMRHLQDEWQDENSPVFIGGLIGPKNDCYQPTQALSRQEAITYHRWQIEELADAGVDCIIAQTIPAVSEGVGMAVALSQTSIPYLISFVINRHGEVLDKTPLATAIEYVDHHTPRLSLGYMVNCVYPTFLHAETQPRKLFERLIGIQANSSARDHDQLDGSKTLEQEDLGDWGDNMLQLNREFGIKILGGCCGTDGSHLQYLTDN